MLQSGDVVELVDTLGLEPSAARRGGSTPSIPTILEKASLQIHLYLYTTGDEKLFNTRKTGFSYIAGSFLL